jgi:LAS superfamily LD-carboxypeptidase LdcB
MAPTAGTTHLSVSMPRAAVAVVVAAGLALCAGPAGASSSVETSFASSSSPSTEDDLTPRPTRGYHKGRRITLRVVTIGWAEVEVRTAKAFLAMREAAARDGVELWIRNGFRSQEQQEWLYQAWRSGWGNRAARPGHSNHQNGRALDIHLDSPATFVWLETHARRFGFRRTVPGEPWHWEYRKPPARRSAKRTRS